MMASPAWVSRQEPLRNRCYFRIMSRAESRPPDSGDSAVQFSVIVPFLDEEDVLPEFVETLHRALDQLGRTYEVIFVDDGSTDGGTAWVNELCNRSWRQAKLIRLTRNFGHMQALTAGLDASRGEWIASLDADLQHPPELIGQLLALAEETESPVAQAVRVSRRGDRVGKRLAAQGYYAAAKRFGGVKTPANVADFRVIHRTVADQLRALPERTRVYRLLLPWLGYKTAYLEYEAAPRSKGATKYSFARMLHLAFSSITAFSTAPLRLATAIGALVGLIGIIGAIFVMFNWALGSPLTGWPSLMAAILILGGIQLMTIGILGEYLAVVLEQVRGRPIYVTSEPISSTVPPTRAEGLLPEQREATAPMRLPVEAGVSADDVDAP